MELVVYSVPVAALIVGLVEMAKRSFRMSARWAAPLAVLIVLVGVWPAPLVRSIQRSTDLLLGQVCRAVQNYSPTGGAASTAPATP